MTDGLKISNDTFQTYSTDAKLNTLFDFVKDIHAHNCRQLGDCEARFTKLERWKVIKAGATLGSGFLGGFAAMLGKGKWW